MRKPRKRLEAKAQYFLLHMVALFSGRFHILLLIVFPLISISPQLSYKLVLARVTVTISEVYNDSLYKFNKSLYTKYAISF